MIRIAPFLPVALGLVTGIVLDQSWKPSLLPYAATFLGACAIACVPGLHRRFGFAIVAIAAAAAGGAMHLNRARTSPPNGIERLATNDGRIVRLVGRVATPPQSVPKADYAFSRWAFGGERTVFLLESEQVEGVREPIPVAGRIRIVCYDSILTVRENDRVEVFGRLFKLPPPRNPGAFDWAAYLRLQGVVASLVCEHRQNVTLLDDPTTPVRARFLTWLRSKSRSLLIDDLAVGAPEEASLLEALILGHRSPLDRALNDVFVRSGCAHFLAASGSNVAILVTFVWFVVRLARQSRFRTAGLMMAAALLYAAVADPRPPILRATVMVVTFCLAYLVGRPTSHLNTISMAAVVLLVFDPTMLFDIGFQLSFTAVLGVVYLAPALIRAAGVARNNFERIVLRRDSPEEDRRIIRESSSPRYRALLAAWDAVFVALAVSLGAWLAGLPIVAHHFQRIQPWGALATLLVYPLFSVVMVLGFIKLLAAALSPTFGAMIAVPLQALDAFLLGVVKVLASLPAASVNLPVAPLWLLGTFGLGMIFFVLRFHRRPDFENSWRRASPSSFVGVSRPPSAMELHAWAWPACGAICLLGATVWLWPKGPRDELVVNVLSVGRGSATVWEMPDASAVVYDLGTSYPWDVGRHVVVPFLRHRGISRLERAFVSHANLDHFNGLLTMIDQVPTGPIVLNRYFGHHSPPRSPGRHLLDGLASRDHPVTILDADVSRWEQAGVTIEVLWPDATAPQDSSPNDVSTVIRVTYSGRSILFTGDIEESAQRRLIEKGGLVADVLLLPHHGSFESTLPDFLRAVRPRYIIRSSHQRTDRTSPELRDVIGSAEYYNTADVGAVQVVLRAGEVRIVPFDKAAFSQSVLQNTAKQR